MTMWISMDLYVYIKNNPARQLGPGLISEMYVEV